MNLYFVGIAVILCIVFALYPRLRAERRIEKLAKLQRRPEEVVEELLLEPFFQYVKALHEECIRARIGLKILPVSAAARASEEVTKYWASAIDELMRANPVATEKVLRKLNLTREHPCEVFRSLVSGEEGGMVA